MATSIPTTCTSTTSVAALVHRRSSPSSSLLGLPKFAKMGKVSCSMEGKPKSDSSMGMGGCLATAAAAGAAATMSSSTAMALVDERLSTEGTGLPFGLSNNLLGWILLGVFGLIWGLYFIYTSTLEEDEESGLSL